MGLFSKLKNSVTGGWATVTVECDDNSKRGERLLFKVTVEVKDEPINVERIYVALHCNETIELEDYLIASDSGYVNVTHSEDLLEERLVIANAQELAANGSFSFNGEIDIPAHLPPSYRGKNCAIKWLIYAGLDMTGNDPDSGWKEITVE